jgi:hypothetical protein
MDAELWDSCDDPELLVPVLLEQPSIRKLRLLACALVRHAPYDLDGRTIWELLPTFDWFRSYTRDLSWQIDCRDVIQIAERRADGRCSESEWEDAVYHGLYARWAAEVDTFGYDPDTFPGSNFRYAAAGAVEQVVEEQQECLATNPFHYLWYMHFDTASRTLLNPENRSRACALTRVIFGNPFHSVTFKRRWESGEVLDLASRIYENRAYDLMPKLGSALKSAGCKEPEILQHCLEGFHVMGCWVVDQILSKA